MRHTVLGVSLGLLGAAAVVWAGVRPIGAEMALDTVLSLKVAAAVLAVEVPEGAAYPEPHEAFVQLTLLREGLDSRHRALLGDGRDAWGRPIFYWSDGDRFVLLSYGSDGVPEVAYGGPRPWTLVAEGSPTNPGADILVVDGELWRGPGTSRDNLRRVMSNMRSVATAIESYSVDFSHYPESFGLDTLQVLESTLEPVYIKALPETDPWQEPFRVRSVAAEGYAIISYGSDGEPEFSYTSWQPSDWSAIPERATSEPGQDLILVDGQFRRWPASLPR
jgi:hypothetical protein